MVNPVTQPRLLFVKGAEVEVSSDKESSKRVWYRATILEVPPKSFSKKRRKSLVEYKSRVTEDGSTPLTEYIDPAYIRPLPPHQDTAVTLEECDAVEARYKDGWWAGSVSRVLDDSRYMVYFSSPPDVMEFGREDLRPHFEWINGKWARREQQFQEVLMITSDDQGHLEHANNGSNGSEVTGRLESLFSAKGNTEEKAPFPTSTRKKWFDQSTSCDENSGLPSRKKKLKLAARYGEAELYPFKELNEGKTAEDPLSNSKETIMGEARRGSGTSRRSSGTHTRGSVTAGSDSVTVGSDSVTPERSSATPRRGSTTTRVCSGTRSLRKRRSHGATSAKRESPSKITTNKKENTRVPKLQNNGSPDSRIGRQSREGNATPKESKGNEGKANEICAPETVVPQESKDLKIAGSSQRKRRGRPQKLMPGNQDPAESDTCREMTEDGISNQALSSWVKARGIQSARVDDLKLSSAQTVNKRNDLIEKQAVFGTDSTPNEKGTTIHDNSKFPFAKRSPVWEAIESMEVFKLIPQRPHFSPLYESKEEYREGSAIGVMVTFAGMFEKIAVLQLDDPDTLFHSILESLEDLGKHGFDVTVPRGRVNELLSIKARQKILQIESRVVEKKIKEQTKVKTKLEEEAEEIKRKIVKLEEKHAATFSKREASDVEIKRLQSGVDGFNMKYQDASCEFRRVATGMW